MSESSFFRGAALTVGNHRYKGTLFWGHKMELDSIMGNCTGGSFQMNFKLLRLGFHALFLNNIDSSNGISNLYSKYQFNGIQNGNCSFDHKVILGKFLILESEPDYEEDFPDSTRGSPDHFCFKYQFKANDWFSISFSGEKDKEEFLKWDKKQKGFDFYSGNIQLVNIGCIKKIVIGDFRAQFGEGLILGSSYLQGSGINIRKTGNK